MERYRPLTEVYNTIDDFFKRKSNKNVLCINGPIGSGKTYSIEKAIAQIDCSINKIYGIDIKSLIWFKEYITKLMNSSNVNKLFFKNSEPKKNIILVDDIHTITNGLKPLISEILKYNNNTTKKNVNSRVNETMFIICGEIEDPKIIAELEKKTIYIYFERMNYNRINEVINAKIPLGYKISKQEIQSIVKISDGDGAHAALLAENIKNSSNICLENNFKDRILSLEEIIKHIMYPDNITNSTMYLEVIPTTTILFQNYIDIIPNGKNK